MENRYLIGVDVGTQGTKASLYHINGTAVRHAFEPSRLITGMRGEVEQDPDEMAGSVVRTIAEIIAASGVSPSEIACVGLDAQMAGIMGIDKDWNAVTPYDSWLDTKCRDYIPLMKQMAEERIIQLTGGQVTYTHGPKILWWKNERKEVYNKIEKFVTPTAYIVGKLCGLNSEQAYIDYTHLHFSGYADTRALTWDSDLLTTFQIDPDKMPHICKPFEIVGKISKAAAKASGLLAGTPVIAGCGDSAASSLGAGITKEGMIYDVAGTASVFSLSTKDYLPDVKNKTILYAHSVIEELWIPLAYISGGGLCIRWFRDMLNKPYEILQEMAESVQPGCDGLMFIPHFAGRTCPNIAAVRGGFIGLNSGHSAAHMYRSILESIAYEYSYYFSVLKAVNPKLEVKGIYGVGGGINSSLFNQIKADVLGAGYYPLGSIEAATYGCSIMAGYAAGIYPDLQIANEKQARLHEFIPDKANEAIYRDKAEKYQELLRDMEGLCKKIL